MSSNQRDAWTESSTFTQNSAHLSCASKFLVFNQRVLLFTIFLCSFEILHSVRP
ncbi:hypothetical protein CIPAW_16G094400 [Carya illinoinensis]|uniref:Uncharacterized protein n=1 Tax=Carya illinoinensis TaxID=32201 RepID=A0A8T1N8P4_CARIL|nr:hypothetical protein CIPAW_16G094400 [Carya illinoinensis]